MASNGRQSHDGETEERPLKRKTIMTSAIGAAFVVALGSAAMAGEQAKLVNYMVKGGTSIPESLTGKPGDPKNGRKVAISRKKGNCLACHVMPIPEQPFHGLVGPDLNGVAGRYKEGELRLRVVDPKVVNPETIMPSFYKTKDLHSVLKKFKGKTIISAEEVEDIIAYLMTLK